MAVDYTVVGRALSAPARSAMLHLLMDGSQRPASELATVGGVRAPAGSEHLRVLVDAGLVTVAARGRQRFYRLADARVATALEHLGHLSPPTEVASLRHSREQRDLARARMCYDHLAGRLGVALTDTLVARGWLVGSELEVTGWGREALADPGSHITVDVETLARGRRPLSRACPDWTERRPHLAGALGAAIASRVLESGWVQRRSGSRGLDVTARGRTALRTEWDVSLDA